MNRPISILALILAIFVIGCGQQAGHTPNYFPTEVGYNWVYRNSFMNSEMVEVTHETETLLVQSVEAWTAKVYIVSTSEWDGTDTLYFEVVPDASVYFVGTAAYPTTEGEMILLYSMLHPGGSWTRIGSLTCEVIGFESVTVPAGTFQAMKIEVGDSDYCEWYVDGVGLVKQQVNAVIASLEAGEIVTSEGYYVVQLTSKNF